MEVGWNDGDIDDLLDRMLQQNAQDHSNSHRPDAAGGLLPNIWSRGADIDVKIEDGVQTLQARTFTDVLANMAGDLTGSGPGAEANSAGALPLSSGSMGGAGAGSSRGGVDGVPPGSAPAWPGGALGNDGSAQGGSTFAGGMGERALSMPDLSYGESSAQQVDSPGNAKARGRNAARPGSKEVHAQRLQQRKTRRREKDRIEEMQATLEELAVEKDKLARHNAGLQAELGADEEELRKLRAAEESALPALADEELAVRFGGDVTLTARGTPVTLSPDQIRAMTREELTDWWRLYVRTLAGLLEAAEGAPGAQPPPDVLQQVQQLQREALFLHIRAAVTNANSVKHFVANGVVDPSASVPEAPCTPAAWWPIAKALDLSQAQRTQLSALWVSFEARVARVLAARRHLHQRIGATMPNGYMGRDFAVNFLKAQLWLPRWPGAHEAMDALKFNLRQEHIVIYDFVSNFHQILTPLQNARCIVRSYPYVPDSAAIATCVAARCGAQSARERLKVKREAPPLAQPQL
ncbi:hypothetical protein WJX81_000781 [Elliptochloris bilobata]|uniref:BZIP domain-containing protein n=1 Tax=Elliptochloris bilobata TaxID=381761 RepID=A0AAW1RP37_9CHLO